MAGLSSIVNIGYHGTSPAIADAIAASGFKGGTFPTWAGKGNIFTSNIDVAKRYGPRQLGVVTSARNLTSPIGGGIGQGGISFGKEIVTKPAQATKGMNLYNKLMSGAYANSPMAQRLLQTGTTAIKNPTNWLKLAGIPLSALTGILSSTPANTDEIDFDMKTMMAKEALFRRKQKQANVFKQMKQKQLAEEAAAKKAAEEKAAADRKAQQQKTIAARGTAQGSGGTFVDRKTGAMKGYEKGAGGGKDAPSQHFYIARGGLAQRAPRYANGGLINFYRYGGYLG
jgi:hypothetical protein